MEIFFIVRAISHARDFISLILVSITREYHFCKNLVIKVLIV